MYAFFKTVLDITIATILLLALSPLFVVVLVWLRIANKGSALFFQDRPGQHGKIFKLVKFKTMTDERDSQGKLLPDAARLTPVGKWIRASSLDELPQLVNVAMGQMSFVGPRPLLVKYLPLYTPEQARRHLVKPGITGWAQVNGRNAISWEQKFEYDVWYADNRSFLLDIKILWLTVLKTIKKDGINAADAATMRPFEGAKK
jgi:undecaprenyl phosphate N,N'-diacetylbacillosamine 1-phosphate transferase